MLASEAAASASALLRSGRVVDIPELVIYSSEIVPLLERDVLAWSVVVDGEGEDGGLKSSTVLIDAHTGRPVVSFDNLQSTMNRWIYDLNRGGIQSTGYYARFVRPPCKNVGGR